MAAGSRDQPRPGGYASKHGLEEYYPAFKANQAAQGNALPGYVEQEFDGDLECGRLEHGFLRVRCDTCHAVLLVDEVFPEQPVCKWVLSVPFPLCFRFACRPEVIGQVLGIVYRCIATHLVKKAGLSRKTAQVGVVTLGHRFGSALNLNFWVRQSPTALLSGR